MFWDTAGYTIIVIGVLASANLESCTRTGHSGSGDSSFGHRTCWRYVSIQSWASIQSNQNFLDDCLYSISHLVYYTG